jgi:hypothetical protein
MPFPMAPAPNTPIFLISILCYPPLPLKND